MTEVQIRPETPADHAAVRVVLEEAFKKSKEADLVDALRTCPGFVPELSLVAEREGEVLGHVLLSPAALEGETAPSGLLVLGPIGVRTAWQRQGIGGQLVRAGLERAALGYRAVALVGHPTYYPRFGFAPARPFGLQCPWEVPDDVFMALPLRPGGLDGMRGLVLFPPPFHEG